MESSHVGLLHGASHVKSTYILSRQRLFWPFSTSQMRWLFRSHFFRHTLLGVWKWRSRAEALRSHTARNSYGAHSDRFIYWTVFARAGAIDHRPCWTPHAIRTSPRQKPSETGPYTLAYGKLSSFANLVIMSATMAKVAQYML